MTPLEWPLWWVASAVLTLEHHHAGTGVAKLELAGGRDPDDAAADHADVARCRYGVAHRRKGRARLRRLRWLNRGRGRAAPEVSDEAAESRSASPSLGAIVALIGGFLLYARQEIFNPDNLAERSKSTLADERTRLAIAQPIVDGIVDSGNGELVNARPLIESVVVSALGTPPAKAAFAEAVRSIGAKLANRSPNTLFLNLTDATVVAAKALDALAPTLGKSRPEGAHRRQDGDPRQPDHDHAPALGP